MSDRVHRAVEAEQIAFLAVGMQGADMEELNDLGPSKALPMDELTPEHFGFWPQPPAWDTV